MVSTVKQCAVISAMLLWLMPSVHSGKKVFKCLSSCSCSKESIICVGSSYVPRITPNDVSSLSIVNGTFSEVKEAMFAHMPSLQLLGAAVEATVDGSSGPLPEPVVEAITQGDLVAAGVLSGNRNFEGRVHPNTRANYLASPPLVIAYAIAGTVRMDFEKEPIAVNAEGKEIFLRDIWPTREEIQAVERQFVIPAMFKEKVNERWNSLSVPSDKLYSWDPKSTYIKSPPFFEGLLDTGKTFQARMRFDTDVELTYFHHGGILNYMIHKMTE
ncbi:hypothetical protein MHYP_G00009140 [Metynnis hypsauchen]